MKHYTIKRGEAPPSDPAPNGSVECDPRIETVALLGRDWRGLRPRLAVDEGAQIYCGQTLFTDREFPEVHFVSPIAGIVENISLGPGRTLDALHLRVDPEAELPVTIPNGASEKAPRETLLSAGFWSAFRARPFGRTPAPTATPDAILVNAVHAAPRSPNPVVVLRDRMDDFRKGCEILACLTTGLVHVCQSPGLPLGPDNAQVQYASFSGTIAAALSGTQIDRLCRGLNVWTIGFQDVAAIGAYFATGVYDGQRVIVLAEPRRAPPRIVRAPMGSRLSDLTENSPVWATSGGPVGEVQSQFLGRFDDRATLHAVNPARPSDFARTSRVRHRAAIASRALETSIAIDVVPMPLLKALSIGDARAARRLGCLSLAEEDLAAATRSCTSGVNYGACLRRVLDELREAEA